MADPKLGPIILTLKYSIKRRAEYFKKSYSFIVREVFTAVASLIGPEDSSQVSPGTVPISFFEVYIQDRETKVFMGRSFELGYTNRSV